jgi:hypothetical protein
MEVFMASCTGNNNASDSQEETVMNDAEAGLSTAQYFTTAELFPQWLSDKPSICRCSWLAMSLQNVVQARRPNDGGASGIELDAGHGRASGNAEGLVTYDGSVAGTSSTRR